MRVFVTGVAGQLGHDVMNELAKRNYEGVSLAQSVKGKNGSKTSVFCLCNRCKWQPFVLY